MADDQHIQNISFYIPSVHRQFDWEGDNEPVEGLPEDDGCSACHIGGHDMVSARVRPDLFRICEDCHIPGGKGPVQNRPFGWTLRGDYENFIPSIYAHYTGSKNMDVKDQSGVFDGNSISSCFGYNVTTGEGTCHGVAKIFAEEAGGYYVLVNESTISRVSGLFNRPSDPYQLDVTVDHMPQTSECMFCHYQEDDLVRLIWGGAVQPTSEVHVNLTTNSDCWDCHTKDGKKPKNFHSDTMGDKEESEPSLPWGLIATGAVVIIIIGGAAYYLSTKKKN
ncbi:MAG: hypothetical protein M8349_07745 [ANME-2 cluster archaeon]|nr:hypothetical protein [ANME-2 cluster archaeon]